VPHLRIRNTGTTFVANGGGFSSVTRLPVIERRAMAVHGVLWSISGANLGSAEGAVVCSFQHQLSAPTPSSIAELVTRDDLWALTHVISTPIFVPFNPPYVIIGSQLLVLFNNSTESKAVNAAIHWTWERVSSVEWAEIHRRTSRETG